MFLDAIVRGEEPSRVRVNTFRLTPAPAPPGTPRAVGRTLYVIDGRASERCDVAERAAQEAERATQAAATPAA